MLMVASPCFVYALCCAYGDDDDDDAHLHQSLFDFFDSRMAHVAVAISFFVSDSYINIILSR